MIDDDIYLGHRTSNRGCFVLVAAALVLLFFTWFFFFSDRGKDDVIEPSDGSATANARVNGQVGDGQQAYPNTNPKTQSSDGTTTRRPGDAGFGSNGQGTSIIQPPNAVGNAGAGNSGGGYTGGGNGATVIRQQVSSGQGAPLITPGGNRPAGQAPSGLGAVAKPPGQPPVASATASQYPPGNAQTLVDAEQAEADGDLQKARALYLSALQSEDTSVRGKAAGRINELHLSMLYSKTPMKEKQSYRVQSGDTLGEIAQKYGTTVGLIKKMNRLKSDNIRIGQRLQLLTGKFTTIVSREYNSLTVKLNGEFFKIYTVGTGKTTTPTPTGVFTVSDKIPNPTWYPRDRDPVPFGTTDNELGTRWLSWSDSFSDQTGYGFHGTWEPETIGQNASSGCVRLRNTDVEELYDLLPIGTKVIVQ